MKSRRKRLHPTTLNSGRMDGLILNVCIANTSSTTEIRVILAANMCVSVCVGGKSKRKVDAPYLQ